MTLRKWNWLGVAGVMLVGTVLMLSVLSSCEEAEGLEGPEEPKLSEFTEWNQGDAEIWAMLAQQWVSKSRVLIPMIDPSIISEANSAGRN